MFDSHVTISSYVITYYNIIAYCDMTVKHYDIILLNHYCHQAQMIKEVSILYTKQSTILKTVCRVFQCFSNLKIIFSP